MVINIPHKMQKKRSPILQRVSNFLLQISIFNPHLLKPNISKNLIFLKKTRSGLKRLKLYKHYNYGFVQEYEFSPSNTSLIQYHHRKMSLKKRNYRKILYSAFFQCNCFCSLMRDDDTEFTLDSALSPAIDFGPFDSGDEEDSVDQRAEMFIEKFYENIRMQGRNQLCNSVK